MAQKYVVLMVDDLDGAQLEADEAESIRFSVNGENHAIDLSKQHAEEFRTVLKPYLEKSRKVDHVASGKRSVARSGSSSIIRPEEIERRQQIREWARKNGYKVSDRGRISQDIVQAFDKAQAS